MAELRVKCPWDAEQTHRSLLNHLIEEACEVVDAVEAGSDTELVEELGDLLLQVYFHAQIATDEGRFTLDDVARGISDKLISRHPHVFGDAEIPQDMWQNWEERKRAEKGRTSALDGIAESLSVIGRAHKVVSRTRSHAVDIELPSEPIDEATVGREILALIARAQANGIDADAAARQALRSLEAQIRATEPTTHQ
ncbi:MazG family protein [Tessaracoccus sp. MC1865]|uniref:MazG family protein n=1 Tax=unclassified Tessaracoccus TaxID=2635419 RepID=UPI00096CBDE9|nr:MULTISPECIES: MazG family protein [unclassified Tessaracoccus]MBB1482415.1 MazG family protein [Tessaracoccus sp. MC1865]MCG6566930.1 nucleoside triphosphate pyrophosphohydrolase [Tessaracoccus sp. ZS01]OMG58147.1 nucleoside triphosphate pyrophosphohydrolase [Tessaracoccus sp. ZS01]QTO38838.1 MazG family protein [Tessaracoccus sp. MC1865]